MPKYPASIPDRKLYPPDTQPLPLPPFSASPPTIEISPQPGSLFLRGEEITFQITYSGMPFFDVSTTVWISSIDGFLGTGPLIKVKGLSVGEHIIDVYCGEFYQGFLIGVY